MSQDTIIDAIRAKMESRLTQIRDDVKDGKTVLDGITHEPVPNIRSHEEMIQTYLLLKILDTLESLTMH